ncbi:hypothetical protein IW261DRAFT_1545542 [Armillaria novae-zelandiae]|uniref:Uncharacterized protein n=1 Tax=Armillaria novae-zelandiae TaxID=153914 RepID=A0AA39KDK0_9AGAR|nr:hypothetical protein IW261DRAFT_1545542 [Armillaria novae-zelandiae]
MSEFIRQDSQTPAILTAANALGLTSSPLPIRRGSLTVRETPGPSASTSSLNVSTVGHCTASTLSLAPHESANTNTSPSITHPGKVVSCRIQAGIGSPSVSQARSTLAEDERWPSVVQALKGTIRRMRATLASVPSPDAGVQDFLRINLDMADLIEMWSSGHDSDEIYALIQGVDDQYRAMMRCCPTAQSLQRSIASIASDTNDLVTVLSNILSERSTKHAVSDRLIVVTCFLRRVKEEPSPDIPHRVSLPPLTPLDIPIPSGND